MFKLFAPLLFLLALPAWAAPSSILIHSHNDYEKSNPLLDALKQRFDSVEADIWLSGGKLMVSHLGFSYRGSLEELYFKPLRRAVELGKGSVNGDGKPFYLWLDIKDGDPKLLDVLQRLLEEYGGASGFLTAFGSQAGERKERAVTVVLTGREDAKRTYVERHPLRYACRDSNQFKINDPDADDRWQWYSLDWAEHFKWNGMAPFPAHQLESLKTLVGWIHDHGRKVRFWNTPETEGFWKAAMAARVDAIGTDHLESLSRFMRQLTTPVGVGL
jgi:glycerophosphoryl diester phosphodiesterase